MHVQAYLKGVMNMQKISASVLASVSSALALVLIIMQPNANAALPLSLPQSFSHVTFSLLADSDQYRIGSTWGKVPVDKQALGSKYDAFRRAALSTAKLGGGTAFYLGKFAGRFIIATNHHVCPTETSCMNRVANFVMHGRQFKVARFLGTWSAVDLTLLEISVLEASDEVLLNESAPGNFAFDKDIFQGQKLLTIGFGVADNPKRAMVANEDDDCLVFSDLNEFRFMADPDALNPGTYKAWSFSNGCDVSHGDSGSAMVDRISGNIVGLIWTGKIPKESRVQDSDYLKKLLKASNEDVWTELSYAVPALKIRDVLSEFVSNPPSSSSTVAVEVIKAIVNR